MTIATDFNVSANGDIRYEGASHGASGAGYYTVIEFHRWLQDLADDAVAVGAGDDFLDITGSTPSERSTDNIITLINGYNIDQTASEHLYDGSIIQAGGAEIWDGLVIIAAEGMDLQIVQNGTVIVDDFWNTVPFGGSTKGLNRDVANGISHRFMIKVRTASADIDGRRLLGQTREWGFTYSEFKINGTSRGNNVMALTYAADLNNITAEGTVATWTEITNLTQGYNAIDADNNTVNEFYYSKWDKSTYTINQFYERMKWLTRRGTASTLYGLNGELIRGITHELDVDGGAGTFGTPEFEEITWGTGATAGVGRLLAVDNKTGSSTTKIWFQLMTGVTPLDNATITGTTSGATVLADLTTGSLQERPLSRPFCGASTGSSIIGAYGFGIEATDLTSNDKVFDLTNAQITPPNFVTFTVSGLVPSEDYVLVGPESGGTFNLAQLSLNATLSTDNVTSVVVSTAIPSDTPASGTIRVEDNVGVYRRLHYSSWSGSTFTIDTTDGNEDFASIQATAGNNVWISYIDTLADATSESFTSVYNTTRALYVRVRDGGASPIKTFETTASLTSGGGSATAIRTSDE